MDYDVESQGELWFRQWFTGGTIYKKTAGDKEHREPLNIWYSKMEYIYIYIYIYIQIENVVENT